jgi:hypothetical protein
MKSPHHRNRRSTELDERRNVDSAIKMTKSKAEQNQDQDSDDDNIISRARQITSWLRETRDGEDVESENKANLPSTYAV